MHWNACFMTEYDSWKQVALLLRSKISKNFRCLKPFRFSTKVSTRWPKVCSARRWMHRKAGEKFQCCLPVINVFLTSYLHWFKHLFILFWVTIPKLVMIWEMATLWLFIISFPFVQEWFSCCSKLSTGMFLWTRQSIFVDWWEITENCEIKIMGISFAAWNLLSTWIKTYDLVLHQKVKQVKLTFIKNSYSKLFY